MGPTSGMRFFYMDIGADRDPKVRAIVEHYVDPATATMLDYNSRTRWVMGELAYLWEEVYRHGYCLRLDDLERRRVATEMGMLPDDLDDFLGAACDVGLFDADVYKGSDTLMSARTVAQYLSATKRSASALGDDVPDRLRPQGEDEEAEQAPRNPASARKSPKSPEGSRKAPQSSANARKAPQSSANARKSPKSSESPRKSPKTPAENKNKKEKEKREEEISSSPDDVGDVVGAEGLPCACMACPSHDGTWYADDAGTPHETPAEALEQRYIHRTGLADFDRLMASVARRCPASCRASPPPERVSACYSLLSRCIDKFDRSKGGSPLPLAMRMIEEDRGW